jgi:anaerobic magnesium-protoporphyrin IX monomethyl ester cyclase
MKVALIRPPEVHKYWNETRPSLSISYIASYLEHHGIAVKIFDANFHLWPYRETVEKVEDFKPDLIGITSMTHEISMAHKIASLLKNSLHNVPTVIGGCHVTALPRETLEEFENFTYGIYGEGEQTMLSLVRCLQQGATEKLPEINGIVYRHAQGITINPPQKRLSSEELDKLPYPAFHHYYSHNKALAGKHDYYVIISSRGCPYNCAFCMQVLGRQVRRRSPENVVAEIEYAIDRYSAHTVYFLDEILLFNDQLTYDTLALMIKHNLPDRIRWRGLTRINFVNEQLINKAKEAGCFALEVGIESGSNEVLKRINKQITIEQAVEAVRIIKKAGIELDANFILGHPHETIESVKTTIDFAAKLNPTTIAVGIMTPYPGTKIYEMALRGEEGYRLLTKDWSKYDKYGGKALELEGLPLHELEKWQRRALLYFYLRNYRFIDLFNFIIKYRKAILSLFLKRNRFSPEN